MRLFFAACVLGVMTAEAAAGQDAGVEFFEKKIRPVLVEHCYGCHSTQAKKVKGKLYLDTRDGTRKGGETGPAVVPGNVEKSLLIKAIRYTDPELKMPRDSKLPDAVVADFEAWVKMGAPDPRDKAAPPAVALTWEQMLKDRRDWWSLQPFKKTATPKVKDVNWSAHEVDRFILAKLEERSLTPAADADPRTLIRRLSLVLTGLPPTPGEIADFELRIAELRKQSANQSAIRIPQSAIIELVDRLLASPHYGERWARHWMDVVRFTETHGNEWNYEVHHAWRYRDYLIRAFNDDLPFDHFIREHLAGDLLPTPRWSLPSPSGGRGAGGEGAGRFNESVIGTAFYRFGEVNHDDCIDLPQIPYDLVDNQIDTLTKAFQATTVACARCHDHKIDAVSMKDYYGLLGILRSSRQVAHTIDAPEVNADIIEAMQEVKAEISKGLGKLWKQDAQEIACYLLAAQAKLDKRANAAELAKGLDAARLASLAKALDAKAGASELPFQLWRTLAQSEDLTTALNDLEKRNENERRKRVKVLAGSLPLADFCQDEPPDWHQGGHGLVKGTHQKSDFTLHDEGDDVVKSILPVGLFTHGLSARLNGTLRSPILPARKKYISFLVMGQGHSAVRLVSNNCQLNYRNFKALTKDQMHWVTLPMPDDPKGLRLYAELMTKFDNPKFPDQLGTLGGDTTNQRVPWEKAASDPRSFFGIALTLLHDDPTPPSLEPIFILGRLDKDAPPIHSVADLAGRFQAATESVVADWANNKTLTNPEAAWLDALVRHGLFRNRLAQSPQLEKLVKEYRRLEASLAIPRVVPGMADFGPGIDQPVFVRGDCTKPGEPTPRRYLEVLSKPGERFTSKGSGRLELAERIASADNPLTARVFVNRVWHHLFGTGLVRSVDDFGRVGELPSHPELLDYLAARFVEEGWSVKKLIRTLVLTRAFQMANQPSPTGKEADPQNRLLHHYPARRMEAEAIRDAILSASGRLDRTLYGLSVHSYREKENADRRLFVGPLDGNGRRSIYIRNTLMEAPRFLGVFDFPGGKYAQGRRDVTNVPAQALALLNDPFVLQQAEVWAKKLIARTEATPAARIEAMFQTGLGRSATKEEVRSFEDAASKFAELHGVPSGEVMSSHAVWKDLTHAMFNLKEFVYIP